MTERSDYDKRMDALAIRLAKALPENTPMADVLNVCAAMIGYSLADLPNDEARTRVLLKINKFILQVCDERRLRSN